MYSKNVLAVSGALIAAVAAVPMAKRDIVWVTETQEDVVTMPVTTTVWVNPGETAPAHYGHHHSHWTSTIQSTVTVPAVPVSSAESSAESTSEAPSSTYVAPTTSSVYVAPTTSSTSVYVAPTTSSTSVYVAPTTSSTSVYVAPTTSSTSVYVAPTTSSTSVYVAPTTSSTSVYVAPTSTYVPSTTTAEAPSGTSGSSGASYTGDITYYDVGLGSCGWTNDDSEAIVALPTGMMQAGNAVNPNNNPYCGQMINIVYNGQTNQAKVVDTCGGCEGGSIDLSPALFKTVAPDGNGRVHDVEWSFAN